MTNISKKKQQAKASAQFRKMHDYIQQVSPNDWAEVCRYADRISRKIDMMLSLSPVLSDISDSCRHDLNQITKVDKSLKRILTDCFESGMADIERGLKKLYDADSYVREDFMVHKDVLKSQNATGENYNHLSNVIFQMLGYNEQGDEIKGKIIVSMPFELVDSVHRLCKRSWAKNAKDITIYLGNNKKEKENEKND